MSFHRSIAFVFALHGAAAGSLATRIPWLQERLDLGAGVLGLILLCPAVGAFIGMPTAGHLAHRFSGRTTTRVLLAFWCAVLALPALAPSVPVLFVIFLLYGVAAGMCDVVMNAEGVALERHLGKPIVSGLHGMWSVGSLVAGAAGVLAAHLEVDARLHLGGLALVLVVVGVFAGRGLMPAGPEAAAAPAPRRFALPTKAILAIGVVGFCGTFAEGASSNWAAVYMTEVTGAGPGLAAAAYTVFMLFMAGTRLAGDTLVRRMGAVAVARSGGALAALGGLLVATGASQAVCVAGFALLGLGLATVVPLVFATAGHIGRTPGEGIAGVATITYLSGLTAPAVTGMVADGVSYQAAFGLIAVMALLVVVRAGALRHRPSGRPAAVAEPVLAKG
ncbi:MFS transporter [Nonomuraea sp. NPDC050310]|uniref:MFS transporter n=1 Tax=Nonomuraea sp. NPDC050310 TaxID=3154935 RepID=UPI0033E3F095